MLPKSLSKNPTTRKVLNAGLEPVIYHTPGKSSQIVSGAILKRGRKYLHFWSPSFDHSGIRKVPIQHEQYMRPVKPPEGAKSHFFNPNDRRES